MVRGRRAQACRCATEAHRASGADPDCPPRRQPGTAAVYSRCSWGRQCLPPAPTCPSSSNRHNNFLGNDGIRSRPHRPPSPLSPTVTICRCPCSGCLCTAVGWHNALGSEGHLRTRPGGRVPAALRAAPLARAAGALRWVRAAATWAEAMPCTVSSNPIDCSLA